MSANDYQYWVMMPVRWSWSLVAQGPRVWWRLFNDSRLSAVANVTVQTLVTVITAMAVRAMDDVEYGRSATLGTYVNWFGFVAGFPVMALIPRFIAEGRKQEQPFERKVATTFWMGLFAGLLAFLAAMGFMGVGTRFYGLAGVGRPVLWYALTYVVCLPYAHAQYFLQCSGRMRAWSVLNLLIYLAPLLSLWVGSLIQRPLSMEGYYLTVLVGYSISGLVGLGMILRYLGWRNLLTPDWSVVRDVLWAGRGGWVATVFVSLSGLAVSTLIVKLVGKTELGYYQMIVALGGWVQTVIVSVTVPAIARWSQVAAEGRFRPLLRDYRLRQLSTASIAFLLSGVVLLSAPWILAWLYGEAYRPLAPLLRVGVLMWVTMGAGAWYWHLFAALGHPGRVMLANVTYGAVQVVIAWILMAYFKVGVMGAMVAYVTASACWLIVYEVVFRQLWRQVAARPTRADAASG